MFRVLGTVLGHAKVLACAGAAAGCVVAAPVAVHAFHGGHERQTTGYRQDAGGERFDDRSDRHNRFQDRHEDRDHDRGDFHADRHDGHGYRSW